MNFKKRLNIVHNILSDCSYEIQKKKIRELFENTDDDNKGDILLRLIVIDSCYSTNMNKRLFGFEELVELILKIEPKLDENIDVMTFVNDNFDLLTSKIGIDKRGDYKGHAFSLITKYIYFKTKFNFPIYDRLVFDGLVKEKLIKRPKKQRQEPSITYFEKLKDIKEKYDTSFDDLDKYFWVCGKIREGNLSLLISNTSSYDDFLEGLDKKEISKIDKKKFSEKFNKFVSKKLVLEKELFQYSKLNLIQKLARLIDKNEKVFNDIKSLH